MSRIILQEGAVVLMARNAAWVILCAALLFPSALQAEDFIFENDLVRWTITAEGASKGLVEKKTGREWAKPSPLALVKKDNKYHPASSMARQGDLWRIGFRETKIAVDCRITARPRWFVIELVAPPDEEVEEVVFARIDADIPENYGGWLNVRWNEAFAVAILGMSDRVNTSGPAGWAMVYPEFGMKGQRAVVVAAPKSQLLDVIQQVERDEKLPSPKIGATWAKTSPDVRRGYFFTDLTEQNADETIRYALLGHFGTIMTYDGTWASSLGSYPINPQNFPKGEESLKAVVDKCHAAGLKVGMHMLTSFVGKNDPLVKPKPDPRLLKDAEAVLAADIDAGATEIRSSTSLAGFPGEPAFYGDEKQGMDLVIDDEIIHYAETGGGTKGGGKKEEGGATGGVFLKCVRGHLGTKAAPHKAGAKIHHLCERYGCYLVDLRTSLKDELADRVAGVFNRCGFDMIYFDGGECNMANGPYWYWVSQQQMAVYSRIRRDILVQGSGGTPWTWHVFARGACDDFAALAPKQYLDYHKIADSWRSYTDSFMPAELGWWGFLDDTPHNPATSPDEVECYAVRMLALDSPVSLETNLSALKKNGRTEELLKLLGEYERLRLSGAVPAAVRERLRAGEWHRTTVDGRAVFRPIRYDTHRAALPGTIDVKNTFAAQPLRFRLQAVPALAPAGDPTNQVLLASDPAAELRLPDAKTPMPGAPAGSIDFLKPAGQQAVGLAAGPRAVLGGGGKAVNLLKHRALAVKIRVDAPAAPATKPSGTAETAAARAEPPAVLNVQLESWGKTYRDHYIDLDFTGERTVILPEPTTERMLPEFRPAHANYAFKAAMYGFNYEGIVAVNLRWMRLPPGGAVRCSVERIEALAESAATVKNPEITVGQAKLVVPVELRAGDYAEYWAEGPVRVFDRNGVTLGTVKPEGQSPELAAGGNRIALGAASPGPVKLTVITLGEPLTP